jgi:xylulokinase
VTAVGCTGARQTFGLFDGSGEPTGPGIVWSDTRAVAPAREGAPGPDLPAGSRVPATLAWVAANRPDQLAASAWILAPRDLVAWRLTGSVATDPTLASLTGCYGPDGEVLAAVAGPVAARLPGVVPSTRVTGGTCAGAAELLGLRPAVPVVIGAGDRQCEVVGTGATGTRPMVSWGTTANVSLPVGAQPDPPPAEVVATRSADGGWQLEGGLSAAGSFLSWLGELCGRPPAELAALAATSPPGARGVTAVPWMGGARAPWWRPGAAAAFVGLSGSHGPADLARAVFESVARDVHRCLEAMAVGRGEGPRLSGLGLAGGGASTPVWGDVLTGITGLPTRVRRSGESASAGAALLTAGAVGEPWELESMDPVAEEREPDPGTVRRYADLRGHADRTTRSLVALAAPEHLP